MATKKSTGGKMEKSLIASGLVTLGSYGDGVTVEETAGEHRMFLGGIHYASIRIDGDEVLVQIRRPAKEPYKTALIKTASKPGWLEWRMPLTRSHTPWLEADIGGLAGAVTGDIDQGRITK